VPRVDHADYILPGDNRVIDRAGWQCTAQDLDEPDVRCRRIASFTHRRRDGDRVRAVALCPLHYELA
jgi:hypothetical protein